MLTIFLYLSNKKKNVTNFSFVKSVQKKNCYSFSKIQCYFYGANACMHILFIKLTEMKDQMVNSLNTSNNQCCELEVNYPNTNNNQHCEFEIGRYVIIHCATLPKFSIFVLLVFLNEKIPYLCSPNLQIGQFSVLLDLY